MDLCVCVSEDRGDGEGEGSEGLSHPLGYINLGEPEVLGNFVGFL